MKFALAAAAVAALATYAVADVVVLNNGDTLNGTIGQVTASSLEFTSPAFGKIAIPLENVRSYRFDAPVRVQPKSEKAVTDTVSGEGTQATVGQRQYPITELKYINPPPQAWTGSIVANMALARGNTNNFTVGAEAKASLRRDDEWFNDRFTLDSAYNYGRTGGGTSGEPSTVETDNWRIGGQWDKFWTEKLYGYTNVKLEHDAIADLYYRLTPGVGLGYQWIEGSPTAFRTEAGVSYVHETYHPDSGGVDNNDYISLRFAYRLEHELNERTSLFHNLEYLPAIDDWSDYNLITDIGLKMQLNSNFLAQVKLEWRRDSTPAEDSTKNDLLWVIGLGWQF